MAQENVTRGATCFRLFTTHQESAIVPCNMDFFIHRSHLEVREREPFCCVSGIGAQLSRCYVLPQGPRRVLMTSSQMANGAL